MFPRPPAAEAVEPNRFQWLEQDGRYYCRYRDENGYDWYGWSGSDFFWMLHHDERWWWLDEAANAWRQWQDGEWRLPEPAAPKELPPATQDDTASIHTSKDGARAVQICGENADAFLYDLTPEPVFDAVHLASHAREVVFGPMENGDPLEVTLITDDEAHGRQFKIYDAYGGLLRALSASDSHGSYVPAHHRDRLRAALKHPKLL